MRYLLFNLNILILVVSSSSHLLDWCTGGEEIAWVDDSENTITKKIAAGAKMAPIRNKNGKIKDLKLFVKDRLDAVPQNAQMRDLPTLIIENHCASVSEATDDCKFDPVGTPAPHNFALGEGFLKLSLWEVKESFTIVFVPAPNSGKEAIELTKANKKKHLASLKVRGNSSRYAPKKQFQIKFNKPISMIPGTPSAKKWIVASKLAPWQPDKTSVIDPAVYSSYRRYGELQKKYSGSWPAKGTIEDLASTAWSPNTLSVILIFQGRFLGAYNIIEKVEVLENGGRVWMPDKETKPDSKEIGGVKIPRGNYLLAQDDEKTSRGFDFYRILLGWQKSFPLLTMIHS